MRVHLSVIYVALLAGSASAQTLNTDDFVFANRAAQVIGGADACGYKLDDEKLTAFMAKIADLDATSRMQFTNAQGMQARVINSMIEKEKKAQCALQAKMAQEYGISR
ncbi:hypothetical protein HGP14_28120 [Rhizobium sp. P32RR-XVIII]|uniref:hypothetical protein n=1 Tax=Rhizobium sp. P32RR-XVIII TaxID=2726738 RepID=UPI001456A8C1|nr:hypothetical protein [Rhizobium sp. P32RR-XVIII]NLS07168.1 hypothetical protein [Rhizobium sp. P32RR-XVIII]